MLLPGCLLVCGWGQGQTGDAAPALQGRGQAVATAPTEMTVAPDVLPKVAVTDEERTAVVIASMSLDMHLIPAEAREEVHATVTLRNAGSAAMKRIPLQISSTLRWRAISVLTAGGLRAVGWTQSPIATDADHTGYAQEAVVTPGEALAPGGSLTISVVYAGEIKHSAARLELLGTNPNEAGLVDWDAIAPTSDQTGTALRGFGNVLWYPVAAGTAALGEGNALFRQTERQRALNVETKMRLRLTVEYVGDPPEAVLFNGRLYPLTRNPDSDVELVDSTRGLATVEVPAGMIGYRTPSLFLTAERASTSADELLTVVTAHREGTEPYARAAASVQTLLSSWLGPNPVRPLTLLDHPGERFEDGAMIVAELNPQRTPESLAPELVRGLTHAWVPERSGEGARNGLWLERGLPEFMALLWTERTQGREAAVRELENASSLLALAEPSPEASGESRQPLTRTNSDVFLRLKSAYVLWQLRELLGEDGLKQGLLAYRHSLMLNPNLDKDAAAFERALEKSSGKELGWFFHDWVENDPGLPDLTIVTAAPRALPARPGKSAGYLVAIEVRNDGDAVADVPVTLRAVVTSATERLRIAPHGSASVRILFEDTPETVQVNDGSVPELRTTVHSQAIRVGQ